MSDIPVSFTRAVAPGYQIVKTVGTTARLVSADWAFICGGAAVI